MGRKDQFLSLQFDPLYIYRDFNGKIGEIFYLYFQQERRGSIYNVENLRMAVDFLFS